MSHGPELLATSKAGNEHLAFQSLLGDVARQNGLQMILGQMMSTSIVASIVCVLMELIVY